MYFDLEEKRVAAPELSPDEHDRQCWAKVKVLQSLVLAVFKCDPRHLCDFKPCLGHVLVMRPPFRDYRARRFAGQHTLSYHPISTSSPSKDSIGGQQTGSPYTSQLVVSNSLVI
jgi:hypothetical protein